MFTDAFLEVLSMAVKKKFDIEKADFPEQAGISSNEMKKLIEDFDSNNIELHSVMMLRHGKLAAECHRAPFGRNIPHTMYSVSKSFTSAAVGFAIDEGLVSLDTRVIDLFPEHRPKKFDEKLENMTVYHLLTMTAGKDVSVLSDKTKNRWVKDFFEAHWAFAPGEGWRYISENTYMCCAIITRLTGMSVIDYLSERLFKPLGIDRKPFWESDQNGIEAGGWGLFITPDEFARFMLCMQQGGKYAGKQVLPEWWVKQAGSHLVDNPQYDDTHSCVGYGLFFWLNAFDNSYRADGMFSQFGIVFSDYDAVFIMTASEIDEAKARDAVFRHFPQMFIDECETEPEDSCKDISLSPLPVLNKLPHSVYEKFIEGHIIHFPKNPILNIAGWPLSMLPMAVTYMSADRAGNIDNVVLRFRGNECIMTWDEGKEHNTIICGMDGKARESKIHLGGIDFTAVSSAAWVDSSTLEIWMRPLESICERRIKLEFNGYNVKLIPSSSPSLKTMAEYIATGVGLFIPNKFISDLGAKAVTKLDMVIESPISGKMV